MKSKKSDRKGMESEKDDKKSSVRLTENQMHTKIRDSPSENSMPDSTQLEHKKHSMLKFGNCKYCEKDAQKDEDSNNWVKEDFKKFTSESIDYEEWIDYIVERIRKNTIKEIMEDIKDVMESTIKFHSKCTIGLDGKALKHYLSDGVYDCYSMAMNDIAFLLKDRLEKLERKG